MGAREITSTKRWLEKARTNSISNSNFDFSNFKSSIRMSNLVEFDLFDQNRGNSTSNLTNFRPIVIWNKIIKCYITLFGQSFVHCPYWGQIRQSNSNLGAKFDLEFEFKIQHFQSNSEVFRVDFEIRPSLNWSKHKSHSLPTNEQTLNLNFE